MNRAFIKITLGASLVFSCVTGNAADFSSCADDLDGLRSAASWASDRANDAESAFRGLEDCKNNRSDFDYKYDQCRGKESTLRSEVRSLISELETVERRMKNVNLSCQNGLMGISEPSSGNANCDLMRRYKGRLPQQDLINVCSRSMPIDQCKQCLESTSPSSK
jgi:hypothetical protein